MILKYFSNILSGLSEILDPQIQNHQNKNKKR